MKSLSAFRLISLFASAAVLAACGGGGGGGSSTTPPPAATTFTVGGTLAGLASGASVILQNNAGSNLTVSANGTFTFATAVASGGAYAVTVLTQPSNQTCTVTSGSGTVSANVTNVAVNCVTNPANTFTVGGTVSGLATGATVVLRNNGANNASVAANGAFTFPAQASGSAYAVTVFTQPTSPVQVCSVTNGSGTVTANVSNVSVTCVTPVPGTFSIGGTVSGLSTGGSVVLRNNGGNDLTVSANGAFTFTTPVTAYAVTVFTQPTAPAGSPAGQTCTVTSGSGTASAAVTNVAVACVNNDAGAPTVTARSPLTNAVGSKLQGGVVTATLSEAISSTNLQSFLTLTSTAGAVTGTVSLVGGNQVVFTPAAALSFDTTYTATLTTAVRDNAGNPLAANVVWSFNTGKKIAIGYEHTCVRLLNGSVKCWGHTEGFAGSYGQLGYDDPHNRGDGLDPAGQASPYWVSAGMPAVNLGTGRTAVAIAAGDYHTCAILDNGDTKCWGSNDDGELGQGNLANQLDTSNPPGSSHGIGDEPTDGSGGVGEMPRLGPINFGGGHKAIEIVGGQFFTCARLDDNTVKCFGKNDAGQLGLGNTTPLNAPGAAIDFGTGLTPISISAGHAHACAILRDNTTSAKSVKCWGGNQWGQLGLGDTNNRGDGPGEMGASLPTVLLGAGRTADYLLATGGSNCAILDNQATKCWGLNTWGQVGLTAGNGDPTPGPAQLLCTDDPNDCIGDQPNEVNNTTVAIAAGTTARLAIGFRHACALLTNNTLKCWGSNEQGQLGLEDNTGTRTIVGNDPNEVNNLTTTFLTFLKPGTVVGEITAGGLHTCVWNTNGNELNCWGNNSYGQLGHNDTYGFPPDAFFPGNYWGAGALQMGVHLKDTNVGL